MSTIVLLVLYGLLIVVASLSGGLVPRLVRLTHQRMQLSLSFVAGAMLGVGLLHLLPHALIELGSIDRTVIWTLAGFLAMFFIERFFAFHHHDISEQDANHGHAHEDHAHHRHEHGQRLPGNLSWGGATIGMSLHSLADGVALAASVQAETQLGAGIMLAGLATFLVVLLHKPFDALTVGTLMAAAGSSSRVRHWTNFLFAMLTPVGALLFMAGLDAQSGAAQTWLGIALAFSAGTFLCIASSDLLPELQFHHHDRIKLSAALVMGIATAWAIGLMEHAGHDHQLHDKTESHDHAGHAHDDHEHDTGHKHHH